MRNKKLLMLLATAMLAGTMGIGTVVASAGTVESKPAGDGLLTSANEMNLTDFKLVEDIEESAPSAYVAENVVDHVVAYGAGEWQGMQVGKGVPKETMAKEDVKVTLTYDFTGFGEGAKGAQLLFTPGTSLADQFTYAYILTGGDNGIAVEPAYRTSATANDPTSKLIAHHGGDAVFDIPVQWQAYSWSGGTLANYVSLYNNATIKLEMVVNENGWVDVTIISGFFLEWPRWTNGGATITNWAPYDGTADFFANAWIRYADSVVLDNANLSVSYTEGGETKTDIIFDSNMDANVSTEAGATIPENGFNASGAKHNQNGSSGLAVTNPSAGSGIITRGALQTDKGLSTNLVMNTQFVAKKLAAGQKVGFGFGYESNREIAGPHSYFYFTANAEGALVFGAEKVGADSTTTLIEEQVVAGATIGADAAAVPVVFTGKGANMEINIGANEKIVLENFDPDGFFAITHKGEGELAYKLNENLTMTGYQFLGNEEGAEQVTANFDGDYLDATKFQISNTIAPETHMVATDNSHALTGITAENGKVGFYGTSTNSRILSTKKYADFVMQFDYISVPVQQRGALTLAGNRPSSAFIMFGMKEGGLPMTDSSVYAIGLGEGMATEFYGYTETVIQPYGMALKCGATTRGLAMGKQVAEKSEISIPSYTTAYDPSQPDNGVAAWYEVDTEHAAHVYSLYNKITRVKLVCIDNNVGLYFAEVDPATGAVKGDYIEIYSFKAVDTEGYVGIGSDSPAYFEFDNFAITPISREDALAFTANGTAMNANVVADIAPADMETDREPTPLAKPALTADTAAKKLSWTAVEGAKDYTVTVKLNKEAVKEETVTATEFDLSDLADGSYEITVVANPADEKANLSSRASVDYVASSAPVESDDPTPPTSDDPTPPTSDVEKPAKKGCGSVTGGSMAILALAGLAVVALKKRKND